MLLFLVRLWDIALFVVNYFSAINITHQRQVSHKDAFFLVSSENIKCCPLSPLRY